MIILSILIINDGVFVYFVIVFFVYVSKVFLVFMRNFFKVDKGLFGLCFCCVKVFLIYKIKLMFSSNNFVLMWIYKISKVEI